MKTLKILLIVTLTAFTMISMANTDGFKANPKKSIHTTFDKAMKDRGLVLAIREQVDPSFLNTIEQLYVVEVKYNNVVYKILGSRQDWLRLFRPWTPLRYKKARAGGTD
mgnify:CR=1 FL=1